MSEFYEQYFCPDNEEFSLIIDDNGQVCYAYLLKGEEVIGDVWLYNQSNAPASVNWNDVESMPFLNPLEYIDDSVRFSPFTKDTPILVDWDYDKDLRQVKIIKGNSTLGILKPNSKPGWYNSVIKDGPLALRIDVV
ncbi:MAG: hypothetical protein AAGC64_14165 [Bacteroidota bacterium]